MPTEFCGVFCSSGKNQRWLGFLMGCDGGSTDFFFLDWQRWCFKQIGVCSNTKIDTRQPEQN